MKSKLKWIMAVALVFVFGSPVIRHFLFDEQEKISIKIKDKYVS